MRTKALLGSLVMGLVATAVVGPKAQMPTPPSTERKLELKFDGNGYATLVAQNVSVSEIFGEWARIGKTKIANAEKLPGGLITVQFDSTEERKLIDALVRLSKAKGAGWIAATRHVDAPAAPSRIDVINIMPSSSPTSTFIAASPGTPLYPTTTIDDPSELPPVMPPTGPGPAAQPPPAARPPQTYGGPGVGVVPVGPGTPAQPPPTTPLPGRGRGGD